MALFAQRYEVDLLVFSAIEQSLDMMYIYPVFSPWNITSTFRAYRIMAFPIEFLNRLKFLSFFVKR